jgi:hypothetical protein
MKNFFSAVAIALTVTAFASDAALASDFARYDDGNTSGNYTLVAKKKRKSGKKKHRKGKRNPASKSKKKHRKKGKTKRRSHHY